MSARLLATILLLSLAVPLAETLAGVALTPAAGGGVPTTALALLPWLALGTLPRAPASGPARPAGLADATWTVLLALPAAALAAGVDLARGARAGTLLPLVGLALAVLFLWAWAAARAAADPGPRARHGLFWLALVPGLAALVLALEWVPRRGPGAGVVPGWAVVDPLVWCHAWGRAPEGPAAGWTGGLLALGGGALALALTLVSAPAREGASVR